MKVNSTESNQKARYWVGVLYPENMIEDWETEISRSIQRPYSYCVHDSDLDKDGKPRKTHVHLMVAWGNPTTYKAALKVFKTLERPGEVAVNVIQAVHGVRYMYNYLIHDTDDARKQGKFQYDPSKRICGCGFDIGNYEQLSISDKAEILQKITALIHDRVIFNYYDLMTAIEEAVEDGDLSSEAYDVARTNGNYLYHLVCGYYQKISTLYTGEYFKLKKFASRIREEKEE